jgi:hypothetical protein
MVQYKSRKPGLDISLLSPEFTPRHRSVRILRMFSIRPWLSPQIPTFLPPRMFLESHHVRMDFSLVPRRSKLRESLIEDEWDRLNIESRSSEEAMIEYENGSRNM